MKNVHPRVVNAAYFLIPVFFAGQRVNTLDSLGYIPFTFNSLRW